MSGELILISMPIGNSLDISLRALNTIKELSVIYAEDTRVFKEQLKAWDISYQDKIIDSFFDHSEHKIEKIKAQLSEGINIGLVSDAGSPMISDPAYMLIKELADRGPFKLNTIPGASAVTTALELSCLPPIPYHFWGFLPRAHQERKQFFQGAHQVYGTHLCFEAPHRIEDSLRDFFELYPEREVVLAKELTKKFQTVVKINRQDLDSLENKVMIKGEFVFMFASDELPLKNSSGDLTEQKKLIEEYLKSDQKPKKLAKLLSSFSGISAHEIYEQMSQRK